MNQACEMSKISLKESHFSKVHEKMNQSLKTNQFQESKIIHSSHALAINSHPHELSLDEQFEKFSKD